MKEDGWCSVYPCDFWMKIYDTELDFPELPLSTHPNQDWVYALLDAVVVMETILVC